MDTTIIDICYRQLTPSDWKALRAVGAASLPQVYPDDYWQMLTSENGTHYTLGAFLREEELVGAVAMVKDTKQSYVVRFMKEGEARLLNNCKKVTYVSSMIVAEKVRRRGIASSLMLIAMDKMETEGTEAFYLHVMTTNKQAIKLYEKMGFHNKEHLPKYYSQPGLVADAFLYVRLVGDDPPPSSNKCLCGWCVLM